MSQQAVASIKASDGTGNYCLNILSSLSLSDEDKLSFVIGICLITFNKHIVCSLSPWISDILKDESCCLKGHVFISLPEETSLRGFLSLKAVVETGVTHELSNVDKDELSFAIELLGMDIQLTTIVAVDDCSSDKVDCDAQQNEFIISTEDMFTHNAEMDSEQTRSVEDLEADDTNNNKTLEPRTSNGMEEIQDANKDLEEINMDVNSMANEQCILNNMKPVLKECGVKINRINRKSFGIMRNCSVKIKRLDRELYKCHLKQPLPSSQAVPRDVDTCFPQSSSSAAPAHPDNTESGKIKFSIKESDTSDSLKSSRANEKDNAEIIVVPTPIDRNDADVSMVPTPIDGNNVQEYSHSTVILHSANCDEFFLSFGHAHSTSDGKATPSHAHLAADLKEAPSHAHSTDDCKDGSSHAHSTDDDKAIPGHAHCTADGKVTQSTHFLTPIKVPNRSKPPRYEPVEEEILMEVDNGDMEKSKKIHDGSLTSILPSDLDAEVDSVPTPSLLGCSKSFKNNVEFSNDEEDVEKQIELVPKIKIKRNLIQWAT